MTGTFADIVEIAVYVLMGGVVLVLALGLGAMYGGGKKSNLFMRWRVGLQFAAIALLALLVFVIRE